MFSATPLYGAVVRARAVFPRARRLCGAGLRRPRAQLTGTGFPAILARSRFKNGMAA
ncbi:MAG: hypothetical protein LBP71_06985 [Spirochaetaceae bacterium]|nr:hypothetical protein [Spirochaetaceae bacterium]